MKPVVIEPPAQTEIDDALTASRNPTRARGKINAALAAIAANPACAPRAGRSRDIRRYVLKRPPYSIIYADDPAAIRVVAFAHHKRKPDYWKSRLRRP